MRKRPFSAGWGWGWDSGRWRYSKKASDVMGTQWANIWSLESARKVLGNADKLVGQEECWAEGTNVQDLICSIHSLSWPHINKHVCWWLTQEPHFNPMNVVGFFFFFFLCCFCYRRNIWEKGVHWHSLRELQYRASGIIMTIARYSPPATCLVSGLCITTIVYHMP